jgi:hypothetical protein
MAKAIPQWTPELPREVDSSSHYVTLIYDAHGKLISRGICSLAG